MKHKPGIVALALVVMVALAAMPGLAALDEAYPPPLPESSTQSVEVVDRDGKLLRAFAAADGRWRLPVRLDKVDPEFVRMLVAYEDRRFWQHGGVDPLAMIRAAWQMLRHGRIVSGGSTITMQLARLLEPRPERSLTAKVRQMARALQIERRLDKRRILELYLTHAPYGGNIEGVRAASLAWFGKEPKSLGLAQGALLVALPQSPERRRPDRYRERAKAARDQVLARMAEGGFIASGEVARASAVPVRARRLALPALAPHLAQQARWLRPTEQVHQVTLSRPVQKALEVVASEAAQRLGPDLSVAMMLADVHTGEVLAEVGSAGLLDVRRSGWIDMTGVPRSPGSALKPFIYALALEDGLVLPETLIEDRPASFDGYRPRNFDLTYQGDVSVRQALQLSLNVPAVRLLQATVPSRLLGRLHRAGVVPVLPRDKAPGLAIGLGGVGVTLKDLVQAYTVFANNGRTVTLGDGVTGRPAAAAGRAMFSPVATWHVSDILSGVAPPRGTARLPIAYKTGTSYGNRDAWSIGFDGRHVLGVWVGRADSAPVPDLNGITVAAPILFDSFARTGLKFEALPQAPAGAVRIEAADLPSGLRFFTAPDAGLPQVGLHEPALHIVYPPDGAHVDLGLASGGAVQPLMLKLQGGRPPYRLLANGVPVGEPLRSRSGLWQAGGIGFSRLSVIDARGRSASISVYLE
ncbi:penicillin-binding protein 1C [Anderseniella sp. Alg231-50]|uniref:penicillin-binding protein 1C n=1 Tax=Anderseniella sp. Alg231-50 TaxID=1922226 RepID=UPI000D55EE3B